MWETRRDQGPLSLTPHKACAISSHFLQTDQDQASYLIHSQLELDLLTAAQGLDSCQECPHPDKNKAIHDEGEIPASFTIFTALHAPG